MCATVGHDSEWFAHALESVPNFWRDDDQGIVVWSEKDLHQRSLCGRSPAFIVEHDLNAPEHTRIVQRHVAVLVPSFHDSRIDSGEVDFTELNKVRVSAFQHVIDGSSFIRNTLQWDEL